MPLPSSGVACPFASWSTNFHSSFPLSKALIRPSSAHPLERVGDTGPVVIWESTLSRLLMRWTCGNQGQGVFPRILTAYMLREARWFRFAKKEVKKASGKPETSGPCNSRFTLFRPSSSKGNSFETRPRSPIVDIERDESLDLSIVHLHHDRPSTSHRNEGVGLCREKPSKQSTSVGKMMRRSKKSAPEERS